MRFAISEDFMQEKLQKQLMSTGFVSVASRLHWRGGSAGIAGLDTLADVTV